MKRQLIGLATGILAATALVAAQQATVGTATTQDPQKAPDVVITGCLTQGSGPTVFILNEANTNPQHAKERVRTFVVGPNAEDLGLTQQVNHKVTITGVAEDKAPATPAAGQKVIEKDLPKLRAKSLTSLADSCSTAAR